MSEILIMFTLTEDQTPPILSQYILNEDEYKKIEEFLESDFLFYLEDQEFCDKRIEISNFTLKYRANSNKKYIDAFKTLYKNKFCTYDILPLLNEKIEVQKLDKKERRKSLDDYNIEDDINYYLVSKKSTPEFSSIDDDKIRKYVIEARKAVDLFKTND